MAAGAGCNRSWAIPMPARRLRDLHPELLAGRITRGIGYMDVTWSLAVGRAILPDAAVHHSLRSARSVAPDRRRAGGWPARSAASLFYLHYGSQWGTAAYTLDALPLRRADGGHAGGARGSIGIARSPVSALQRFLAAPAALALSGMAVAILGLSRVGHDHAADVHGRVQLRWLSFTCRCSCGRCSGKRAGGRR